MLVLRLISPTLLIMGFRPGLGSALPLWLRQYQPHTDSQLVRIAQLGPIDVQDVCPASWRAELALGNRGERVSATYGDLAVPRSQVLIEIGDLESPADLQPVRPAGQHRRIRCCDSPPFAAVPVVPLGKAPQIVTGLHHMLGGMINSLHPRSCRGGRLSLRLLDDQSCRLRRRARC